MHAAENQADVLDKGGTCGITEQSGISGGTDVGVKAGNGVAQTVKPPCKTIGQRSDGCETRLKPKRFRGCFCINITTKHEVRG